MFENKELAEWLEDVVKQIVEKKCNSIAFVAKSNEGKTFTAYFKCGPCKKVEFASNMQINAMSEVIDVNKGG